MMNVILEKHGEVDEATAILCLESDIENLTNKLNKLTDRLNKIEGLVEYLDNYLAREDI